MKKILVSVLVIILALGSVNINFGATREIEIDLVSNEDVLRVDYDDMKIWVLDTNSGFFVFFDKAYGSKIVDKNGEQLQRPFRSSLAKKIIVRHYSSEGTVESDFEVIAVKPFIKCNDYYQDFYVSGGGTNVYNVNPDMTYGEYLESVTVDEGVEVYYENQFGRRLSDLSELKIITCPNTLVFKKDGLVIRPSFHFEIPVSFNGVYGIKVKNSYKILVPRVSDMSANNITKMIMNENPVAEQVHYYNGNAIVNVSGGGQLTLSFVDKDSYNFKPSNQELLESLAFSVDDKYKIIDEGMFSSIDKEKRMFYGIDSNTTIQDFVDNIIVEDGYTLRFIDNKSSREIVDYSRELGSYPVISTILTDGKNERDLYLSFDLPLESKDSDAVEVDDKMIKIYQDTENISVFSLLRDSRYESNLRYGPGSFTKEKSGRVYGAIKQDSQYRYFAQNESVSPALQMEYTILDLRDDMVFDDTFSLHIMRNGSLSKMEEAKTELEKISAIKNVHEASMKVFEDRNSEDLLPYIIEPISKAIQFDDDEKVFEVAKEYYEAMSKKVVSADESGKISRSFINHFAALSRSTNERVTKRALEMKELTLNNYIRYSNAFDLSKGLTFDFRMAVVDGFSSKSKFNKMLNVTSKEIENIKPFINGCVVNEATLTPKMISLMPGLSLHVFNDNADLVLASDQLQEYQESGIKIVYNSSLASYEVFSLDDNEKLTFNN